MLKRNASIMERATLALREVQKESPRYPPHVCTGAYQSPYPTEYPPNEH